MPYYIYSINPGAQLKKLRDYASFNEASAQAKAIRASQVPKTLEKIKVIFAENELQAEDLLLQVRTPGPKGDD
jgi:hypothetical protein